jgi:7-carboxy-7-deazaguanine synthase
MLAVNDVYRTIQGEGCMTGTPMVLVRLQGCGVGCPFCDTKETWDRAASYRVPYLENALGTGPHWCELSEIALAQAVSERRQGCQWALITGGEPADQPLAPLVQALHDVGMRVALETSGTATGHLLAPFDWVCVSPKIAMPGGKTVLRHACQSADELKMVIGKEEDLRTLKALLHDIDYHGQVCLQPMSASERATELCVAECIRTGWRLSVQTHKVINVR